MAVAGGSKMPKVYHVECLPNEMQRLFLRGGAYSSGVVEFYQFYMNRWSDLPARAPGRLALPIHWGLAMTWRLGRRAGSQWQAGQVCILDRI